MNGLLKGLLAVAAGAVMAPGAEAGVIANWDFNSGWTPSVNTATVTGIPSSASLTATAPSGETILKGGSSPDFSLTFNPGTGTANNVSGSTLVLQVTTSASISSSAFTISYGANSKQAWTDTWAYSFNNTTWTSFATNNVSSSSSLSGGNSVTTGTLTFTAGSTVYFRDTLSGANNNVTVSFDNISVNELSAVPEPVHYALAVFGVVFVGSGVGRRYYARMKRA